MKTKWRPVLFLMPFLIFGPGCGNDKISSNKAHLSSKDEYLQFLSILNLTEEAYFAGNNQECLQKYKEAAAYMIPEDYYAGMATLCARRQESESDGISIFKNAIASTRTNPNNFYHSEDIRSVFGELEWESLNNYYNTLEPESLDPYEVIAKEMIAKDQVIRNMFGLEGYQGQCLDQVMEYIDSTNLVQLKGAVQKFGWKPEFWLILWHQRGGYPESDIFSYIIPFVNKSIEEGVEKPYFWAQFEDFISYVNGENKKYGTAVIYDSDLKSQVIYRSVAKDSLNYYRRSVGLSSIESYCLRSHLPLPQ